MQVKTTESFNSLPYHVAHREGINTECPLSASYVCSIYNHIDVCICIHLRLYVYIYIYISGAGKSLARPGRKQAAPVKSVTGRGMV